MSNCGHGPVWAGIMGMVLLAAAGCSSTSRTGPAPLAAPLVLTGTQPADVTGATATPAVLVDPDATPEPASPPTAYADLPPLPSTAPAAIQPARAVPASAAATTAAPILSPSEKARVIAELEALARAQTPTAPPALAPPCTLDPSVLAGLPQPPTAEQMSALCAAQTANP